MSTHVGCLLQIAQKIRKVNVGYVGRRDGSRGHEVAAPSFGEQVVLAIRGIVQGRGEVLRARVDRPFRLHADCNLLEAWYPRPTGAPRLLEESAG